MLTPVSLAVVREARMNKKIIHAKGVVF